MVRAFDKSSEHLATVNMLLESTYNVKGRIRKRKDGNFYELRVRRKKIYIDLLEAVGSLSMSPTIPFTTGFTDAEGYIHVRKDGRVEFGLTNTDSALLARISKLLTEETGVRTHLTKRVFKNPERTVYYLRVYGWMQVSRIMLTLNPLHPRYRRIISVPSPARKGTRQIGPVTSGEGVPAVLGDPWNRRSQCLGGPDCLLKT